MSVSYVNYQIYGARNEREKEKRQTKTCRFPSCTRQRHPNRATCDDHACRAGCTKGYPKRGAAFCERKGCSIPACSYPECTSRCLNEVGKETRCAVHQPYICTVCQKETLGHPNCE